MYEKVYENVFEMSGEVIRCKGICWVSRATKHIIRS